MAALDGGEEFQALLELSNQVVPGQPESRVHD